MNNENKHWLHSDKIEQSLGSRTHPLSKTVICQGKAEYETVTSMSHHWHTLVRCLPSPLIALWITLGKTAVCFMPGSRKWKEELKLKIKSLKWNTCRWQTTAGNLPLRGGVGRSSATCRRVWACRWLDTPSKVSPQWLEPCLSLSGPTEALLRTQNYPRVNYLTRTRGQISRKEHYRIK